MDAKEPNGFSGGGAAVTLFLDDPFRFFLFHGVTLIISLQKAQVGERFDIDGRGKRL